MRRSFALARRRLLVAVAGASLACLAQREARAEAPDLLVFGAASLTDALEEIGARYTRDTGQAVRFSFAASSALARQIEAGARADVFLSADLEWMDYLESRGRVERDTRRDLLGNRLALVAPASSGASLAIAPGFPLAAALGGGRLATGDPDYVPVGRYARAALTSLGVWNDVADRLVRADNVRTALAYVARGEAPLGIVYETDAKLDPAVEVLGLFPADSHPPITYPVAVVEGAREGAARFVAYLSGDAATAVFRKLGFAVLAPAPEQAR
jgi:molybdate transport system substrate-binding protein